MVNNNLTVSSYLKGVLFGDGSLLVNHKQFLFATTRNDLKNTVEHFLKENNITYYIRRLEFHGDKENYEDIYKIFIEKEFYDLYLSSCYSNLELNLSYEFLLGYIETKGSFFHYTDKKETSNVERWRLSLSGEKEILNTIKSFFESDKIKFTNLVHRKERENEGIISKSYRLYLNRRYDLRNLVENILVYDCSVYLKTLLNEFITFDNGTPFHKSKEYYKSYRIACTYLMKELNVEYRGNKTDNVEGTYIKKIYRFENGEPKEYEKGWEGVYYKLLKDYEERFQITGPKVLL